MVCFRVHRYPVTARHAVDAAHASNIKCIALNGKSGGKLNDHLLEDDVNILVSLDRTAYIQVVHGVIIHCLCELIDEKIIG